MDRILKRGPRRVRRRGAALVEFALVMPLLLLLLVGIMEFGRAWSQTQVITDAARQGARLAALLNNSSAGQDSVRTVVLRALAAGNVNAIGVRMIDDRSHRGRASAAGKPAPTPRWACPSRSRTTGACSGR